MAIYTTQKSQTYGTIYGAGHARNTVTDGCSVALTTAMIDNANDEVELLWVPAGAENQWNRKKQNNNTSGYVGVNRHGKSGKWEARIRKHGKVTHLGLYDTAEAAANVRQAALPMIHGEFARLS